MEKALKKRLEYRMDIISQITYFARQFPFIFDNILANLKASRKRKEAIHLHV